MEKAHRTRNTNEEVATAAAAAAANFTQHAVQNKYWQSVTSFGAIVIQPTQHTAEHT